MKRSDSFACLTRIVFVSLAAAAILCLNHNLLASATVTALGTSASSTHKDEPASASETEYLRRNMRDLAALRGRYEGRQYRLSREIVADTTHWKVMIDSLYPEENCDITINGIRAHFNIDYGDSDSDTTYYFYVCLYLDLAPANLPKKVHAMYNIEHVDSLTQLRSMFGQLFRDHQASSSGARRSGVSKVIGPKERDRRETALEYGQGGDTSASFRNSVNAWLNYLRVSERLPRQPILDSIESILNQDILINCFLTHEDHSLRIDQLDRVENLQDVYLVSLRLHFVDPRFVHPYVYRDRWLSLGVNLKTGLISMLRDCQPYDAFVHNMMKLAGRSGDRPALAAFAHKSRTTLCGSTLDYYDTVSVALLSHFRLFSLNDSLVLNRIVQVMKYLSYPDPALVLDSQKDFCYFSQTLGYNPSYSDVLERDSLLAAQNRSCFFGKLVTPDLHWLWESLFVDSCDNPSTYCDVSISPFRVMRDSQSVAVTGMSWDPRSGNLRSWRFDIGRDNQVRVEIQLIRQKYGPYQANLYTDDD